MIAATLLLHNIRSLYNVGSIFRTSDGFGVTKIICSGYTPYPPLGGSDTRLPHVQQKALAQIHKTALGAEHTVPFEYIEDPHEFLSGCRMPIYALEQTKTSTDIRHFTPDNEFVLILGEEVNGIPNDLLSYCHATLEIPMCGQKESFNVSVAAAIALYQLLGAAL